MKKCNPLKKSNPLVHAIKLLNIRPRAKEELKQLLSDRNYSIDEIDQVISQLIHLGYLNDLKFMESWCYFRQHISPRSRWYVRRELSEKGVSPYDLEEHYDKFYSEEEELNCLQRLIEKRLAKGNIQGTNRKDGDHRKLISALVRKGFKHYMILDMLNQLEAKYLDIYREK